MDISLILRIGTILLAAAAVCGGVLAAVRFGSERSSPPLVVKLHGFLAVSALSLLVYAWSVVGLPVAAAWALGLLLVAALGGVTLNLVFHAHQRPLPEGLVFAHMSLGFVGWLVLLAASLSTHA